MSGIWVWVIRTSTLGDRVGAVAVDQPRRGPLDHVDGGLVLGDVVAEVRRAEHQVVAQVVGVGELRVVVGADRLAGQVAWRRRSG